MFDKGLCTSRKIPKALRQQVREPSPRGPGVDSILRKARQFVYGRGSKGIAAPQIFGEKRRDSCPKRNPAEALSDPSPDYPLPNDGGRHFPSTGAHVRPMLKAHGLARAGSFPHGPLVPKDQTQLKLFPRWGPQENIHRRGNKLASEKMTAFPQKMGSLSTSVISTVSQSNLGGAEAAVKQPRKSSE
ncbi:hypothetical protein GWK47_036271 [Chionoecetes opilio]|uniref:Uncharacterized protein n=1 Tax=Chionoecetes opilio TaxID=41210 RepID=A0A8J4YEJ3_CHIOP|nr:hypothetical protein GWK47_036271 [Chionoecetes opilio]